jgi:hypothetical protein
VLAHIDLTEHFRSEFAAHVVDGTHTDITHTGPACQQNGTVHANIVVEAYLHPRLRFQFNIHSNSMSVCRTNRMIPVHYLLLVFTAGTTSRK